MRREPEPAFVQKPFAWIWMKNLPVSATNTVVACSDDLIKAEIDGEILALNVERGACYGMNVIGSRVWNLVAQPIRVCDLCSALLKEYRVDPEVCERQVLDLLEELRAEGLIAIVEEQ
jgi:hypothetical protein